MNTCVALVNPPYSHLFGHAPFFNSRIYRESSSIMPPLGLLSMASYLEANGIDTSIIDMEAEALTYFDLKKQIKYLDPVIVGVTATTALIPNALKILHVVKNINSNVFNVLGGPHVSALPYEMLKYPQVNGVVIGEGEQTMLAITKAVLNNHYDNEIKGAIFKRGNKFSEFSPRPPTDLDKLPPLNWDLLKLDQYHPSTHRQFAPELSGPQVYLVTSRGCPYRCKFCSSWVVFGRKPRFRSALKVIDDLNALYVKKKVKKITFYDDIFSLNKDRLRKICQGVKENKLDLVWECDTRIDTVNRATISMMQKANCRRLHVGVESGVDSILHSMWKGITIEKVRCFNKMTKELGISTSMSFIIGAPGETKETISNTIKFAKELNPTFAHFYIFVPHPGSAFFDELKNKTCLKSSDMINVKRLMEKGTYLLKDRINLSELIKLQMKAYQFFYEGVKLQNEKII